jgi:hypothetical protein
MENGTCECQKLLKGRKIIKNKWAYKLKLVVDGNMDHYKTSLVAKGFTQKEGVNFKETCFNLKLVGKFNSIRIMFSITIVEDMNITQFDFCTSFFYSEIEEEIYMTQPLGFKNIKETRKACRFKAMYGLQ